MTINGNLRPTINDKMHGWSLIDPKPIVYRHPEFDEILVAWNGIHMIFEHAFMIAAMHFWSINPTPEMKVVADEKFLKLYNMGAFGPKKVSWDTAIEERFNMHTLYSMYYYYLRNHFREKLKDHSKNDVFDWFQKAYN